MPKLWNDTIEAHRRGVRESVLDTTWALVNERGPASAKMSEIAERTGIGRATLRKYFPDVESVLPIRKMRQRPTVSSSSSSGPIAKKKTVITALLT
jgi:hypothetical protein